jgi:hypothetical protein
VISNVTAAALAGAFNPAEGTNTAARRRTYPRADSPKFLPPRLPPDSAERNGLDRIAGEAGSLVYRCVAGLSGAGRCRTEKRNEVLETGALAIELHSYVKHLAAAEPLMLPSLLPKFSFHARGGVYSRPENRVELGGRILLHRLGNVAVKVQRCGDGGVAKPLLRDLRMHASG